MYQNEVSYFNLTKVKLISIFLYAAKCILLSYDNLVLYLIFYFVINDFKNLTRFYIILKYTYNL